MPDITEEERKKLAKQIIREFWFSVDVGLGRSFRKKLAWLAILFVLAGSLYFGVIKIPGNS